MNLTKITNEKITTNAAGEPVRRYTAIHKEQVVKVRIIGEPSREAIEGFSKVFYDVLDRVNTDKKKEVESVA